MQLLKHLLKIGNRCIFPFKQIIPERRKENASAAIPLGFYILKGPSPNKLLPGWAGGLDLQKCNGLDLFNANLCFWELI